MNLYQCNLCGLSKPCIKIQDENLDNPRVCTQQKIPVRGSPALPAKWVRIDGLPEWCYAGN